MSTITFGLPGWVRKEKEAKLCVLPLGFAIQRSPTFLIEWQMKS